MKFIKNSIFHIMIITSTVNFCWSPAGKEAVTEAGRVATIIIDKTAPIITSTSTEWAKTLLIISEKTGISIDKMTVVVDKLGTGIIYVAAAGVTIYGIKLACNAGSSIKSTFWPSLEEIQTKLKEQLLIADDIARLQAKKTFETCLDLHITESGFPNECESVAKAYAKYNRYNEVNSIRAFFNQTK